jgi:prepilin-type N-terminal cleavage/methylation domain-containing protein
MKKKAFTLIEVLVAMAIVSIAILPIMSMYPSALKLSQKSTELEEWARTTQTIVDYIKSRGYTNISSHYSTYSGEYNFSGALNTGYTSEDFGTKLFGATKKDLFVINTKGMKLDDYKFKVIIKKTKPTVDGDAYEVLDMENHKYDFTGNEGQDFYYGVVKIREKNVDFDTLDKRDINFVITPIDNWR